MGMEGISPLALEFAEWWRRIFIFDYMRYLIAATAMTLILFVFMPWLKQRKIQKRRAKFADRRREFLASTMTAVIFSLNGTGVYFGTEAGIFQMIHAPIPNIWIGAIEITAVLLFHDAYFYWAHRAMHHPKLYNLFHKLHHRSITPTPWAAYAFAAPEAFVEAAVMPLMLLFFPLHDFVVFLFMTFMILRNVMGHSGYEIFPRWWLDKWWLSWVNVNTHHDLHHSTFNYNYGLYFRWWDKWMGTEHPDYKTRFLDVISNEKPLAKTPATS
ncbi:MAG: sterol desaturase family protein [Sphingomonadales bacterium]|jgi:sterol desaturase/sphingolipid hydroxylase (fatty acid hydroxylase superfamily)